mgnify:CR=1 FL=1
MAIEDKKDRDNTRNDKNGIENGVKTIEVTLATCNIVLSAMICSLSLSTLL